jgi:hypothetical protein
MRVQFAIARWLTSVSGFSKMFEVLSANESPPKAFKVVAVQRQSWRDEMIISEMT